MRIQLPRLVLDEPGSPAVMSNGQSMAIYLGYKVPENTPLTRLEVVVGQQQVLFGTEVEAGVYLSAVWAESWATYCKFPGKFFERTPEGVIYCCTFNFDDYAQAALERYMGEKICSDARNPELDNHQLLRTLLNPDIHHSLVRIRYYFLVKQ